MISKLGLSISRVVERIVPDPFVIAIFLTIITAIAALLWGNFGDQSSIVGVLDSWRDSNSGIWKLLAFSMQMCLILVTGYALATTSLVESLIRKVADIPNSTASAAAFVGFIAWVCGLLNWGLGLIVGALLARAGHDVTVVARGPHLDALKRHGLRVESTSVPSFTVAVDAATAVEPPYEAGLVLFAVKTYDLDEAARIIEPAVGREAHDLRRIQRTVRGRRMNVKVEPHGPRGLSAGTLHGFQDLTHVELGTGRKLPWGLRAAVLGEDD